MPRLLRWFCLLLLPFVSLAQMPPDFKLSKILGTPVGFPYGVGVDAQGAMYLLDGNVINKLSAEGTHLRQFGISSPDPARPQSGGYGMGLDAGGNMYVADFGYGEVRKFSPEGTLLLTFPVGGYASGGAYGIPNPENLAVDTAGSIYVVGSGGEGLIKFDAQGQRQWAYSVPGTSSYNRAKDVATDAAGNVYLLDASFTINKLNGAGQLLSQISLGGQGRSDTDALLTVDRAGSFYLSTSQGTISKFDALGKPVRFLDYGGSSYTYTFSSSTRTALATDAAGNVYATTRDHGGNSKLYKFDAAGRQAGKWGNLATYRFPVQDGAGNLLVFDGRQIIKRDAAGRELLRFGPEGINSTPANEWGVLNLACDQANNLYALEAAGQGSRLRKFSPQGQLLGLIASASLPISSSSFGFSSNEQYGLAVDPAGLIWVSDFYGCFVRQLDQQGRLLRQFGVRGTGPGQLSLPRAIAADSRGFLYVADENGYRVQKFTPTGQLLWRSITKTPYYTSAVCSVSLSAAADGTVAVGSSLESYVQLYDARGQQGRKLPLYAPSLSLNRAGTRLVTTYSDVLHFYEATSAPKNRAGQITGRVFQDSDQRCQPATAPGIPYLAVVAEPGDYYALTDENGNYTIAADTGTYTVRQLLPADEPGRTIRHTCTTQAIPVRLTTYDGAVAGPDFGNQVSLAPYLSISVASNRRRRCFRNQTTVSYTNRGFAAAPAAKVFVKLPEHVVLISAGAPYTRDEHGNYVFSVGDLAPQQQGRISIIDSVACGNPAIRGLTVCTRVWITPDNPVLDDPQLWNQGSVTVRGRQGVDGQVRFALVNKGRRATGDSLALRLFADARLLRRGNYALAAGDSLILRVPAPAGQALRLEADQPAHHPVAGRASATVENGPSPGGQPNPARQMLAADVTPATQAEDCQPIIDSFDPNDKQVLPTGTGPEHYTPTGAALHYRVRFQNTGTDVAYRVEIVDSLSTDLDLRTLRVGAASHPYQLRVSGKSRPVLIFTFDNIMLPEQRRDEAGSNGFVTFTIRPKANLTPKARIENLADIFFDYNEPVRTNATLNRIYDVPPTADPAGQLPLAGFVVSPELRELAPVQGRAGTLVTLRGRHFGAGATSSQVSFNGVPAPVLSAAPGTLTVRVPAGAASGRVRVLTADGGTSSSTDFIIFQPPTLTAAAVTETTPGAALQLSGTHFSTLTEQDTVSFSGVAAVVLAASATQLTVRVPAGTPDFSTVRLATLGGVALLATPVRVWQRPQLLALSANKGKAGDLLTLGGRHFAETPARNEVHFGPAVAEVVQATTTELRVRVPAGSASGPVRVNTPGGEGRSDQAFAFVPAPRPLRFSPAAGPVGSVVTLSGQDFNLDGRADSVYFAGGTAKIVAASATELRVLVPRGARSGPLRVAGAGGRTTTSTAFQLLELTPDDALRLYPNPAPDGKATLDWRQSAWPLIRVRMFDVRGALRLDIRPAPLTETLPLALAGQRPGLYLVLLETAQGQVRKHLVVE